MTITKNQDGAALVIALEGRLDTTTAPELEKELKDALPGVTGLTLDLAACALPLFMGLERLGEGGVPDFDISRQLMTTFLNGSFLTVNQGENWFLLTWKLAGIVMLALFPILVWDMIRSKRDGDTCLLFLLLFGACSVLLESLRYDRFLSITFVGLEHVAAALYLAAGVITLAVRADRRQRKLGTAAVISVFAAAGIGRGKLFGRRINLCFGPSR